MSTSMSNEPDARKRSTSRSRAQTPPARPTTPLRPPSRSSLRGSHAPTRGPYSAPAIDVLEPAFAELSDGMADLEANFMHLQIMHESLSRFSECFASFLHGLKVNAFCVDFPEAPIPDSFRRARDNPLFAQQRDDNTYFDTPASADQTLDPDQTFLTTDTSFVDNPPASSVKTSRVSNPATRAGANAPTARGGRGRTATAGTGRGTTAGRGRGSSLARASGRGRGAGR